MQPEPQDEYFLGSDHGHDDPADNRRIRNGALLALAVVVLVVASTITLTSLLVETSSTDAGPRTAARAWVRAVVHSDTAGRRSLECAAGTDIGNALARVLYGGHYGLSVGAAQHRSTKRWSVRLEVDSADGAEVAATSLTVVRESGRYLVC